MSRQCSATEPRQPDNHPQLLLSLLHGASDQKLKVGEAWERLRLLLAHRGLCTAHKVTLALFPGSTTSQREDAGRAWHLSSCYVIGKRPEFSEQKGNISHTVHPTIC